MWIISLYQRSYCLDRGIRSLIASIYHYFHHYYYHYIIITVGIRIIVIVIIIIIEITIKHGNATTLAQITCSDSIFRQFQRVNLFVQAVLLVLGQIYEGQVNYIVLIAYQLWTSELATVLISLSSHSKLRERRWSQSGKRGRGWTKWTAHWKV